MAAMKEKTFPTKELFLATEDAYNTFYTENHINIPVIKSSYYAASIGISLSKIICLIQSLKIA